MQILSVSAYCQDAATYRVVNGRIVAAAQEERCTTIMHDASFPAQSLDDCLAEGGRCRTEIGPVVCYEKLFLKFDRLLDTCLAFAPLGFGSFARSMPLWLQVKLLQEQGIEPDLTLCFGDAIDWAQRLFVVEQHHSHAISALCPSPFEEAAMLTVDGVGAWTTTSLSLGKGHQLELHKEPRIPHPLGLRYSPVTRYTGLNVNSGAYKVMGLAPLGRLRFVDLTQLHQIEIRDDGAFALDMACIDDCAPFNGRGESMVELPEDVFRGLMGIDLDLLVIGNCLLKQDDQIPCLARDCTSGHALY